MFWWIFFHLNFFYILLVQDNCCLTVLYIMKLYIFSSVFVDPQDMTVTYGEKEKLSFNRERQPSVTTFWGEGWKQMGQNKLKETKCKSASKEVPKHFCWGLFCTNTPKQWFRLADPLQTISFIKKESLKSNLESRDGICFHNSEFVRPILLLEILWTTCKPGSSEQRTLLRWYDAIKSLSYDYVCSFTKLW